MAGEKVFISTYGCQMNGHDTERMYSLLESNQYLQALSAEEADVIIINSCSVREKPVHKVMSEIGTYRPLQKIKPKLKIGVGGCVGQQEGKNLLKKAKNLDFVFGTDTIDMLPEMLSEVREKDTRGVWTRMGHRDQYSIETLVRNPKVSELVTITKGCDNFCSFCVVPFTRGREKSRPMADLIKDVRGLVERGVQEITLLGQNVNSYKSPDGAGGFNDLLRAICVETDLKRLRFTTSHPKDFGDDLLEILVKHQDRLGHYLHLPAQSGSTRLLEKMNRGYTVEEYVAKIEKMKKAMPEVSLSTDLIVGFPGETDQDFEDTLKLMDHIEYENVFAFKYSPRPFTKAATFSDQVPVEVMDERLQRLMTRNDEIGARLAPKYENKTFDVLVEGPSRYNPNILTGRTSHFKLVNFSGDARLTGQIVSVHITKAFPVVLRGEIVS